MKFDDEYSVAQKKEEQNMEYNFVTVKQMADWLRACDLGDELGFTNDEKEDIEVNGEPTGWYGVTIVDLFDNPTVVFGYYGGGAISCGSINYEDESFEDMIITFFNREFDIKLTEDSLVCVDANDYGKE